MEHQGKWRATWGIALALVLMVAIGLKNQMLGDFYWHLVAGQWMVKHGSVIHYNTFSYALGHSRWTADEWGYEWLLGWLDQWWGQVGWVVASAGMGCVAIALSSWWYWLRGARGGKLGWLAVLTVFAIAPFVTQGRGLTMSLIWLPGLLILLHLGRERPWWLAGVPVILCLWINTHGSVLLGLGIVVVELVWSVLPGSWLSGLGDRSAHRRSLLVALVVGLGACCLTPYGPGLLAYDLGVSTNTRISAYIVEWMPPDFHNLFILGAFLAVLAVLGRVLWLRRGPATEVTLAVLLSVAAIHSVRFLLYAMVLALGVAAADRARLIPYKVSLVALITAVVVTLATLVAGPAYAQPNPTLPVAAFTYLDNGVHSGRVFTTYEWGGYSIWRGRQTYIDGRTDLFTDNGLLNEYIAVSQLQKNPDMLLDTQDVTYVVWPKHSALSTYLEADLRWQVVYQAGPALVFERR
jgi:hypothetical protein